MSDAKLSSTLYHRRVTNLAQTIGSTVLCPRELLLICSTYAIAYDLELTPAHLSPALSIDEDNHATSYDVQGTLRQELQTKENGYWNVFVGTEEVSKISSIWEFSVVSSDNADASAWFIGIGQTYLIYSPCHPVNIVSTGGVSVNGVHKIWFGSRDGEKSQFVETGLKESLTITFVQLKIEIYDLLVADGPDDSQIKVEIKITIDGIDFVHSPFRIRCDRRQLKYFRPFIAAYSSKRIFISSRD